MKRCLLAKPAGGLLAVVVDGADIADAQLLMGTIDAVVLECPPIEDGWPPHSCLDKGYVN